MAEKRLSLDQVPFGAGGGSGGSFTLATKEAIKNDGASVSISSGTFSPIAGTQINFTILLDQEILFLAELTAVAPSAAHHTEWGIRVNGVDHALGQTSSTDPDDRDTVHIHKSLTLTPGSVTAEIVARHIGSGNTIVENDPGAPSIMTAVFVKTIAVVASLTRQEAIVTSGSTSESSQTFVPVAGSLITVDLAVPQTVLFHGCGSLQEAANGARQGQLGLRVTAPGPVVTDFPGTFYIGAPSIVAVPRADQGNTIVVCKALALGAGVHTAELIFRKPPQGGTDTTPAQLHQSTDKPATLLALFTAPEEVVKVGSTLPEDVNAGDVAAPGTSGEAARVDHEHGVATDVPVDTGTANAEGASTSLARADHVHALKLAVLDDAAAIGTRPAINFTGPGVVATDDVPNNRVNVAIQGAVETIKWHFSGSLVVGTKVEGTWIAPRAGTITRVTFHRETAGGTGGSTIVDVHKNDVTVFTTQGDRPTITQASGNDQFDAKTNMDITAFAQDDKLTFDIDQIETGTAPVDGTLTMEVTYP